MNPARSGVAPYLEPTQNWYVSSPAFSACFLRYSTFQVIASPDLELYRMPSDEPPPSYYGTTLSEKPVIVSEKPAKSNTYHITLQRCKRIVSLESGRYGVQGLIEDEDLAITIPADQSWPEVRTRIFDLYQKAWPVHMYGANYLTFGLAMSVQYSIRDGDVLGRIHLLDLVDDGLWDFLKRDDVDIINLIASSAPRYMEARGEIDPHPRKSLVDGLELAAVKHARQPKDKGKSKHRCVLQ